MIRVNFHLRDSHVFVKKLSYITLNYLFSHLKDKKNNYIISYLIIFPIFFERSIYIVYTIADGVSTLEFCPSTILISS